MSNLLDIIEESKISLDYNPLTKRWVATIRDYNDYDYHNSPDAKSYLLVAEGQGSTAIAAVKDAILTPLSPHPSSIYCWLPKGAFKYPERDCYWLVRGIRAHYKLSTPDFSWVYDLYPTIESQPKNLAEHCLNQCARLREGVPQHLDIALISQNINADLGTVLKIGAHFWLAYMSHTGAVIEPLGRRIGLIVKSYWVLGEVSQPENHTG